MRMIHRTLALAATVTALAAVAGGAALADSVCHRAAGDREYGFFNLGANCGALSTG
jgi:hypothetical protein